MSKVIGWYFKNNHVIVDRSLTEVIDHVVTTLDLALYYTNET